MPVQQFFLIYVGSIDGPRERLIASSRNCSISTVCLHNNQLKESPVSDGQSQSMLPSEVEQVLTQQKPILMNVVSSWTWFVLDSCTPNRTYEEGTFLVFPFLSSISSSFPFSIAFTPLLSSSITSPFLVFFILHSLFLSSPIFLTAFEASPPHVFP